MGTSVFSRRALLTAASAASGSWVLSACGSQEPQTSGNTSATASTTPSATGTTSPASVSSSPTATPKVTKSSTPSNPTIKPSASPTANEKPPETKPSEKANPETTASESSQPKDQKSQPEGGTTEEPSAPESKKPAEHTSVESHPESLRCIVNKTRPFSPQDWAPQDLVPFYGQQLRAEAAAAAQSMMDAAARDGVTLTVSSAYRSFAAQKQTYQGRRPQIHFLHGPDIRNIRPDWLSISVPPKDACCKNAIKILVRVNGWRKTPPTSGLSCVSQRTSSM